MWSTSIPYLVFLYGALCVLPFCRIVSAEGCNRTFTAEQGFLEFPFQGYYSPSYHDHNTACIYDIVLPVSNKGVVLEWEKFEVDGVMPKCSEEYVQVFVGCYHISIGKYCSHNVDAQPSMFDIYSPDNCIRLKFHLDGRSGGFSASYRSFERSISQLPDTCSSQRTDLTSKVGLIGTPNWPGQYPPNKNCYWAIEVGGGNDVQIAYLDFDLERTNWQGTCDNSPVRVEVRGSDDDESYDNSRTLMDDSCHSMYHDEADLSKKLVWIGFRNDRPASSKLHRGFVLGYVIYDTGGVSETVIALVVAIVVLVLLCSCCGCWYRYRKRRSNHQRVPVDPPLTDQTHPVSVPPPTQSYPMQPMTQGDPPPPSYHQATSGAYPLLSTGIAYPSGPPPPGGAYPAVLLSAPYANPGGTTPYSATTPPHPPAGGAGYPPSGTPVPNPTS